MKETQSVAEYSTMMLQTGENTITIEVKQQVLKGIFRLQNLLFKSYLSGLMFIILMEQKHKERRKIDIEVRPTIKGILEGKMKYWKKQLN